MDGKKSKFDYASFRDGCESSLCVNADKYSPEEAMEIARVEGYSEDKGYKIDRMFVRHRAGTDDEGEKAVGWWMEDYGSADRRGFVPVYAFERY